jgi:hypothetical protein
VKLTCSAIQKAKYVDKALSRRGESKGGVNELCLTSLFEPCLVAPSVVDNSPSCFLMQFRRSVKFLYVHLLRCDIWWFQTSVALMRANTTPDRGSSSSAETHRQQKGGVCGSRSMRRDQMEGTGLFMTATRRREGNNHERNVQPEDACRGQAAATLFAGC